MSTVFCIKGEVVPRVRAPERNHSARSGLDVMGALLRRPGSTRTRVQTLALVLVACAKHTVMTHVPKPNWLGAHANTHGGSWIRGMLGGSGYLRAEARSKGPVEMPSRVVKPNRWGAGGNARNALEDEKELQRRSRMNKL